MNRRNVFLSILITAATLCGCGARYAVTGIERSRVLIDKRYDAANESTLSNLMTDILVWAGQRYGEQPQFGVYNIGGLRAAIVEGDVTRGDIINVAPFENKVCFITLTGEQVQRLFEQIAKRGGEGVSSSVRLVIDKNRQLKRASIDGKPIDPKAQYRVVTNDYVVQGNDGMPAFKEGTQLVAPQSEENNVRYVMMDYFREQMKAGKTVCGKREGRITIE